MIEKEKRQKAKTKIEAFNKFSLWLNLPSQLLGQSAENLEKAGIDDLTYQELITIKTRAEFSRRFRVSQKTLVFWSKEVSVTESDKMMHKFFAKFTKSLLLAFFYEQMMHPAPQRIATWYEIVKGRGLNGL